MEQSIFPIEILELIAWCRRDVYVALSSVCVRTRRLLSLSRAIYSKKFVRCYATIYDNYSFWIRYKYWITYDHSWCDYLHYFPRHKLIELRRDSSIEVIKYAWDDNDNRVGKMRQITRSDRANPMFLDNDAIYDNIGKNTFEAVVNSWLINEEDIVVEDNSVLKQQDEIHNTNLMFCRT